MRKSSIYEAMNVLLKNDSYLLAKQKTTTTFSTNIINKQINNNITSFSKVDLPFLVKGTLITAGVYDYPKLGKIKITKEELKKSVPNWKGIYIYKNHGVFQNIIMKGGDDVPIDSVIGRITDAFWNENLGCIEYEAEIADEGIAYKISRGLISFVSVSFTQDKRKEEDYWNYFNIHPLELSLVFNPRDKNASIIPK